MKLFADPAGRHQGPAGRRLRAVRGLFPESGPEASGRACVQANRIFDRRKQDIE